MTLTREKILEMVANKEPFYGHSFFKKDDDLSSIDFTGANLRGVTFNNVCIDYANFTGADLGSCEFIETSLYDANFTGANLYGANLRGANLMEADFTGANLSWAYFKDCSLSRANFTNANLYRTKFVGTNLHNARDYADAGFDWRGYHFRGVKTDDGIEITAGCRRFTYEMAINHWKCHENKDALMRVELIKFNLLHRKMR